jgi:hypothetical protein
MPALVPRHGHGLNLFPRNQVLTSVAVEDVDSLAVDPAKSRRSKGLSTCMRVSLLLAFVPTITDFLTGHDASFRLEPAFFPRKSVRQKC